MQTIFMLNITFFLIRNRTPKKAERKKGSNWIWRKDPLAFSLHLISTLLKKSQNILIEDEGRRNQEALIAYFWTILNFMNNLVDDNGWKNVFRRDQRAVKKFRAVFHYFSHKFNTLFFNNSFCINLITITN